MVEELGPRATRQNAKEMGVKIKGQLDPGHFEGDRSALIQLRQIPAFGGSDRKGHRVCRVGGDYVISNGVGYKDIVEQESGFEDGSLRERHQQVGRVLRDIWD